MSGFGSEHKLFVLAEPLHIPETICAESLLVHNRLAAENSNKRHISMCRRLNILTHLGERGLLEFLHVGNMNKRIVFVVARYKQVSATI